MSQLIGTQVEDAIVPKDSLDKYPTHLSRYGKGGAHTDVADLVARDAIPSERREVGMRVYVLDAGGAGEKEYQLRGGILNANWVDISAAGLTKKETEIEITAPCPAGTVFSLVAGGVGYTVQGDVGNFGSGGNFLSNKNIVIKRNRVELRKQYTSPEVTYISSTTFSISYDLDTNEALTVITE